LGNKKEKERKEVMTKLVSNHVVFSYDNPENLHTAAKFYRYLDTQYNLAKLKYRPILGTGCYNGVTEPIVLMDYNDFQEYVYNSDWVKGQKTYLRINPQKPQTITQQGTIEPFPGSEARSYYLGKVYEITQEEAERSNYWSFLASKYYICGSEANNHLYHEMKNRKENIADETYSPEGR